MVALVTLLTVAVGLLALLVVGLLRSHAEILRALHDLGADLDPNGTRAPRLAAVARTDGATAADIDGVDVNGAPQRLAVVGVDHPTLLAFLSSTCLTCREFWTALTDPAIEVPANARVVIVTRSAEAESPAAVRKLAPRTVHTVMSTETWQSYGVPGAPYFVLVDGGSGTVVGEGTATTWDRMVQLVAQAIADGHAHRTVDADLRAAGIEPGDPSLYPERGR